MYLCVENSKLVNSIKAGNYIGVSDGLYIKVTSNDKFVYMALNNFDVYDNKFQDGVKFDIEYVLGNNLYTLMRFEYINGLWKAIGTIEAYLDYFNRLGFDVNISDDDMKTLRLFTNALLVINDINIKKCNIEINYLGVDVKDDTGKPIGNIFSVYDENLNNANIDTDASLNTNTIDTDANLDNFLDNVVQHRVKTYDLSNIDISGVCAEIFDYHKNKVLEGVVIKYNNNIVAELKNVLYKSSVEYAIYDVDIISLFNSCLK